MSISAPKALLLSQVPSSSHLLHDHKLLHLPGLPHYSCSSLEPCYFSDMDTWSLCLYLLVHHYPPPNTPHTHTPPALSALFLLLSWLGPVCWPCPIYYFLSLLWILPGVLVILSLTSAIKTFPLRMPWRRHTISISTHRCTHLWFALVSWLSLRCTMILCGET